MSVRQPQRRVREPADLRLMGVRTRPEADPGFGSSSFLENGQQSLRALGDVVDSVRIDGPVEADGLHGGSRDSESVAALQDVGVAVAKDRRARAWFQAITDQMT